MWAYQILLKLLTPFIFIKLRRFADNHENYSISQALGEVESRISVDLWMHCASVGEVLAVRPLVAEWQRLHPQKKLLITTMTPTGAAQVDQLFKHNVQHHYLPVDFKKSVKRFLDKILCSKLVIVETEMWPNLLMQCQQNDIEVFLINARLSERSLKKYLKFASLSKKIMQIPKKICAHDGADAKRFEQLGAKNVCVTGNIKFDLTVPNIVLESNWRSLFSDETLVWVGASTHEDEETLLCESHKVIKQHHPHALLILVPRHPERFEDVYKLAKLHFTRVAKRSEVSAENWSGYDVIIGDSMGELLSYYHCSDVAFVGGSLIKRGGHNPIEPALLSKPILVGEHTFNFKEITQGLIDEGAGLICHDESALASRLLKLLGDSSLRMSMGEKALFFARRNQGAVGRVLSRIGEME